jgi:ketosteroid isomerase-like protein
VSADEVLAANDAFYSAFNKRDMAAMDAIWAETARALCVHPGWNALLGRDAVMQSWRGILTNPAQPRIMSGGATVELVGDVAVVICRELVGGAPLVATNLFVLEDGTWKIFHHHSGPVAQVTRPTDA